MNGKTHVVLSYDYSISVSNGNQPHLTTSVRQPSILLSYASRKMCVQPLNSSFISRVKKEDATVQCVDGTGLHDVGHRLSVTADTQLG